MADVEGLRRAQALEAYESIPSLDRHGELTRLILAEVSLLADTYRHVRRHDVPHVRELAGLLDVFWQEIDCDNATEVANAPELAGQEPSLL
jgi:hypothetical protein